MRLDTVTRIERFITDSLLSSVQIPLGVNVIRLADDSDTEGITAMTYSIVVRYTGSSAQLVREVPLTMRRTLSFEITHAAQSYLSQSGHDYAMQMCAGAHLTLNNSTPVNTGAAVVVPLYLSSEKFDGLSDSSHYIYTQSWECTVEEIFPSPPVDPCVQRGNCSFLFPSYLISEVLPGDVLSGNALYAPVLPPPEGADYEPQYAGVVVDGANLVYTANTSELFLENWTEYTLVSSDTFDETGELLIVNIYDSDGNFVERYFAANYDGRRVIQLAGFQPNSNSGFLGGLVRSPADQLGNNVTSGTSEPWPATMIPKNEFGFVSAYATLVYEDPSDPDSETSQVKYGVVYPSISGITKVVNEITYIQIGRTKIGKAWIRQDDYTLINYDARIGCDDYDEISNGTPDGGGTSGKIDTCD